jgi:hypothetical protein
MVDLVAAPFYMKGLFTSPLGGVVMSRYPVVLVARANLSGHVAARLSGAAAMSAFTLVFAAGCNPQNAQLEGASFTAFLSTSTSPTYLNDQLGLNTDPDFNAPDAKFTSAEPYDTPDGLQHYQFDCRTDVTDDELLPKADFSVCNSDVWPPQNESWATFDGYDVIKGDLAPWRGEAIITSEHDFQLTFHQNLPGGGDFRFMFVVDPNFAPSECRLNASGQSERTPVDGDWIAEWSKDIPEDSSAQTRFYLNAGSYQFNPDSLEQIWVLPPKWLAGFANANFVGETFNARSVRYGKPAKYLSYESDSGRDPTVRDLYFVDVPAGTDPNTDASFQRKLTEVQNTAADTTAELAALGQTYTPAVQSNVWRPIDGRKAGLDSWVELNYNFVDFDQAADDLTVGSEASGSFNLVFDASESQSKLFLQGRFVIDKITADPATVVNLQDLKQEEYGTTLCGADAVTE